MTTININKLLLEQGQDLLYQATRWKGENHEVLTDLHDIKEAVKAALAAPDNIAEAMITVADRFAHKLALDLECVLADYSGTWYDTAMKTLGEYRSAMNAIHERECPTFMGEPVIREDKP